MFGRSCHGSPNSGTLWSLQNNIEQPIQQGEKQELRAGEVICIRLSYADDIRMSLTRDPCFCRFCKSVFFEYLHPFDECFRCTLRPSSQEFPAYYWIGFVWKYDMQSNDQVGCISHPGFWAWKQHSYPRLHEQLPLVWHSSVIKRGWEIPEPKEGLNMFEWEYNL